jgi:hypothetical protein
MSTTTPVRPANVGEFALEAANVSRELAKLPPPIQAIVRRLHRAYAQRQLLDLIEEQIRELARSERAYVSTRSDTGQLRILPEDRRNEYVQQLLFRAGFLKSLRLGAQRILRAENIQKQVFPEKGLRLNEHLPGEGSLVVAGSTRFNRIEAIFETLNVGVAAAVGNWIVDHSSRFGTRDLMLEDEEPSVTVLAWHCGIAGVLALVLDFLKPLDRRFAIVEVDVFGAIRDRQDSTWWTGNHGIDLVDDEKKTPVVARLYEVPQCTFDWVVLDMPPPALPADGGGCVRNTWKTQDERRLVDPGRLCPKVWRRTLRRYLEELPHLLIDGGQGILVLPLSIREARGYRHHDSLLVGIERWLGEVGLQVVRDLPVHELRPVAQPFVGSFRPERRLIIVTRRAP